MFFHLLRPTKSSHPFTAACGVRQGFSNLYCLLWAISQATPEAQRTLTAEALLPAAPLDGKVEGVLPGFQTKKSSYLKAIGIYRYYKVIWYPGGDQTL